MHRMQITKHGHFRKRTLATSNDYVNHGSYIEVVIYGRNLKEKARALIDPTDVELTKQAGSWCLSAGYAYNGRVGQALHRFLLGKKEGLEIDHINGNKLDNRRSNLRFVAHSANVQHWVDSYKQKLISDFKIHISEGKNAEEFFAQLIK